MKLYTYVLAICLFVLLSPNLGLSQDNQQSGKDKPFNQSEEKTVGDGLRKVISYSYEPDIDIEIHEMEDDIESAVENALTSFELSFEDIDVHQVDVDLTNMELNLDGLDLDFDFHDINIERMEFDMEDIDINIDEDF